MQSQQNRRPRASKEAVFVRVEAPDKTVMFANATSYVGKKMPYAKPKALCGMRVSAEVVSFSLLQFTKAAAKAQAEKEVEIPRGALNRVERRATALKAREGEVSVDDIFVDMNLDPNDPKATPETFKFKIEKDENGVVSLELPDGEEDRSFNLLTRGVRADIYLRSPGVGRMLAVTFNGHLGKPETAETVRRVVSMILFSLTQLTDFKILSGMETVHVPANSARFVAKVVRKASDKASVRFPVNFFTDGQPNFITAAEIEVDIDLEDANPTSNRLLLHITPHGLEDAELFEGYREIIDRTVTNHLVQELGADDVASITYDIILGDISSGTIERMREALEKLSKGFDFTPVNFRAH